MWIMSIHIRSHNIWIRDLKLILVYDLIYVCHFCPYVSWYPYSGPWIRDFFPESYLNPWKGFMWYQNLKIIVKNIVKIAVISWKIRIHHAVLWTLVTSLVWFFMNSIAVALHGAVLCLIGPMQPLRLLHRHLPHWNQVVQVCLAVGYIKFK